MKLRELAQKRKIKYFYVVSEEGDTSKCLEWSPTMEERYGDIPVKVAGQGLYESGWHALPFPQESVSFGLVVITE